VLFGEYEGLTQRQRCVDGEANGVSRSRILLMASVAMAWAAAASAQETKTFVAYSMKVAQARVEAAVKADEDFRKKQPDLYYLGGITKPWAVVLDAKTGDWILVGERDPKSSVLTLDDWVTALRARFIHAEKDPGVTIDPRPCAECRKAGVPCKHATKQDVRFFGGIENTHFGQVCYEADWLMKRIGLGLERLPVERLKTYYDLSVEQARNTGAVRTNVGSRFWFYPIVNRVNVIGDVVLLEKFQMGVFTEVLYAEVEGKPVTDVDKFEHYPSEGFSRSFSENYDSAAEARELLETLRGLTRLAALAKGLCQLDRKPSLDFCLTAYPMEKAQTPRDVEVLTVDNRDVGFEISGGVSLTALAMQFRGGDTSAFRKVVLGARPSAEALLWGFAARQSRDGQPIAIRIPSELAKPQDIAGLMAQAAFLAQKKRYDGAIESYSKVITLNPQCAEAYNNRGVACADKGDLGRAISDYDKALVLDPQDAMAYSNRAAAYNDKGEYDRAISDCGEALELNPNLAKAYNNRGVAYHGMGWLFRAITDFDRAIAIDPRLRDAYNNRGCAYVDVGDYGRAVQDLDAAAELDPNSAVIYSNRGNAYSAQGDYERAIADYERSIALDANHAEAYFGRGAAYYRKGDIPLAIADYDKTIDLNPNYYKGYSNRAAAYAKIGDLNLANSDIERAIAINPRDATLYKNRGLVYELRGDLSHAIADYDRAIKLDPSFLDAYCCKAHACESALMYDQALAAYRKVVELAPPRDAALVREVEQKIGQLERKR